MKRTFLITLFLFSAGFLAGQGNPGFMGRKMALNYQVQYGLLRSGVLNSNDLSGRSFNHHLNFEIATRKYKSFSVSVSYLKAPVVIENGTYKEIQQNYTLHGDPYQVEYTAPSGSSNYRSVSVGVKFGFYRPYRSIAAPEGMCRYFRFDIFRNEALENKYTYETYDFLTPDQQMNAVIPPPGKTGSINLSVGYGMDYKFMLSRSLFLKINGEVNFSTNMIRDLYELGPDDYQITMDEFLKENGRNINVYRNFLTLGAGLGFLL